MTRYAEPSTRARQLFFLIVLLLFGAMFLLDRADLSSGYVQGNMTATIDESIKNSFISNLLLSVFYIGLSTLSFILCKKAINQGQWPIKGIPVPFRIKITEIKKAWKVWVVFIVLMIIFSVTVSSHWIMHFETEALLNEIKHDLSRIPESNVK